MSDGHPGLEFCPYCKKPFKRLKSHLPYCKMARSTDVSGDFIPAKKGSSAAMPPLLNAEKKKGKAVKSTEATSKKESEKNKPELGKNKMKGKTNSSQGPAAKCSNWDGGEDAQIRCTSVKASGTGGSSPSASEDGQAQPVEKVVSKASTAEKLPRKKKSRSAGASGGARLAPEVGLEPDIQGGNPTSELPSQETKCSSKHSQSEEATPAEQKVSRWFDFPLEDLPPVPQEIDRLELVIEKHRARLLTRKSGSKVQNEAIVSNHKTEAMEALPGGEEIVSTNGQKVIAITERRDGESIFGFELAGDVLSGETVTGVITVGANITGDQVVDSCATFSSLPVLLSIDMEKPANENTSAFNEDNYPKTSPVGATPEPKICLSMTETLKEKSDIEILNNYLTQLEKDIPLYSRAAVALDYKTPRVPLRQLSVHTPETTAAHWFSPLDRGTRPGSLGLEWFPELYPNYHRLGLFSRRSSQWSTPVTVLETQVPIQPCKDQQVSLVQRRLMNVRLQDLPDWLFARDLSPQGLLGATCRGWNSYYNKYINVKKSGMAGISVLLIGCCTLSYAWSYEHIKHSRWRKYH